MKEPDFSKAFPRRFVTMSMQDKYMAVCFIYDGIQYQNLCREENPDGTFNYSEKCLSRLPYRLPALQSFIGGDTNTSLQDERGLARYDKQEQTDFPDIIDAISHYWFEVLILCILFAITFHIVLVQLKRRSLPYSSIFDFIGGYSSKRSDSPKVEEGKVRVGKISFHRDSVLGEGSRGTFVYRGYFEEKLDCAVKRIISQYNNVADREVELLRPVHHPNIVRYLATENDGQFIYIALELAEFTLASLIEADKLSDVGMSREELCRQSALGLHHLHKLNIVHRDIKPQNILISFPIQPNKDRKVLITDFGISKQISKIDAGHTSNATRYTQGTQGWMSPEIVKAQLKEQKPPSPTKSADIFSLGCVFYYILSEGQHPFGLLKERQDNIINNKSLLEKFSMEKSSKILKVDEGGAVLASKLIRCMIKQEPEKRPTIGTIIKYPFFWSKGEQLDFLQDVSDTIDREVKQSTDSDIVRSLEFNKKEVIGYGWKESLCQEMKKDLFSHRSYKENKVRDLLRLIRNKKHHYRELQDAVKTSLGEVPDGFMEYFTSRFPELLPHVYEVMRKSNDTALVDYYDRSESYNFNCCESFVNQSLQIDQQPKTRTQV